MHESAIQWNRFDQNMQTAVASYSQSMAEQKFSQNTIKFHEKQQAITSEMPGESI